MTPKPNPINRYLVVVGVGWLLLGAAAAYYAHLKAYPLAVALPVAIAFLVEYPFYLLPGFASARDIFMAGGKSRAASVFAAGAIAPWLIYAISTGHFSLPSLLLVVSIAVVMSFWYVLYPAHPATDLIYLALFAAVILFKVFARVYPRPLPKLDVSVLGHLMLIRVTACSLIAIRGNSGVSDYRFMPTWSEFLAGLRWFAMLLPVVGVAYWALGLMTMRPQPWNIPLGVGTFFGILWVVALSEEFLFRGLLQPWIERWTSSGTAAIVLTSLLFGSVHLSLRFHGGFPNWRFSVVAALVGVFCGMARRHTGGIQAGMVAHALTVAVWKTFLL